MKQILNFTLLIVILSMMITFYANHSTAYANDKTDHECVQCGKPVESHGGSVTIEHDGENLTFCCQGCINEFEKGHDHKSHKDKKHNHDHDDHEGHGHGHDKH